MLWDWTQNNGVVKEATHHTATTEPRIRKQLIRNH